MYAVPFRKAVLLAYKHLRSLRKTAKLFDISVSTLQRWCNKLQPNHWPQKRRPDILEFILSFVTSNPFATCMQVCRKVYNVFDHKVSRQLVSVVLKTHAITYKRARHCVPPSKDIVNIMMPLFCTAFQSARPNLICIDETNVSEKTQSLYGWYTKGKRLKTKTASKGWNSKTVVLACSETHCTSQTLSGACNSVRFAEFIRSLPYAPGSTILMDNVAFHKSALVRASLIDKQFAVLYTPPYSPDANPVENLFSRFKSYLRTLRANDVNMDLSTAISSSLANFKTVKSFASTYDHALRCIQTVCMHTI